MFDVSSGSASKAIARQIVSNADSIEAELISEAKNLARETYELIKRYHEDTSRKPPCTLSVKSSKGTFGVNLLWISFTHKKRRLSTGEEVRFTSEIRGRKNGKYPRSTFRYYNEHLREQLWDVEQRAAELRDRIAFWKDAVRRMRDILGDEG